MSLLDYEFESEYDLMLSAWGEGTVKEGNFHTNLSTIYRKFRKEYSREPRDVSLCIEDTFAYGYDYGFTIIDTAFLEQINTLAELILPDSITAITMTPTLEQILKRNNVLIRGSFDSFAEKFAAEKQQHHKGSRGTGSFAQHSEKVSGVKVVATVPHFGYVSAKCCFIRFSKVPSILSLVIDFRNSLRIV